MDIDGLRKRRAETSAKVSEIVRQLNLAGVAIVWLFSATAPLAPRLVIAHPLLSAGCAFILGLLLDLSQAVWRAETERWMLAEVEKEISSGRPENAVDIRYPTWVGRPPQIMYTGKIIATVVGFAFVGGYLVDRLAT
jgi:hypothetical protein